MPIKVPSNITIALRLYHDLLLMLHYTLSSDKECGGFLIKAKHGHFGVVAEQFGEGREIYLEPNEELYEGELLYGTVHMHPITDTFSTGDVKSYLSDDYEKVMLLVGNDAKINIAIKIPNLTKGGNHDEEIEANYEQKDMKQMANDFGFLFYQSSPDSETTLTLQTETLLGEQLTIVDSTIEIEQVVDELGVTGSTEMPHDYSTKKFPKKTQTQMPAPQPAGEGNMGNVIDQTHHSPLETVPDYHHPYLSPELDPNQWKHQMLDEKEHSRMHLTPQERETHEELIHAYHEAESASDMAVDELIDLSVRHGHITREEGDYLQELHSQAQTALQEGDGYGAQQYLWVLNEWLDKKMGQTS